MEPIAHLEWTLGIGLICLALFNMSVDAIGLLLLGIGAVFPDIFDWVLFHGEKFVRGHRELSHTVFFVMIIIIIAQFIPILGYLAFGSILHILEDVLGGRDPIFLFSPVTHRGSIMLITKEQSIKIGAWFRNMIKGAYIGSDNIGDELSWYWLLTIIGSWILMLGIFLSFV